MSDRAKVEQKLASLRARDDRLKAAGEKMSRGLSRAASKKPAPARSAPAVRRPPAA